MNTIVLAAAIVGLVAVALALLGAVLHAFRHERHMLLSGKNPSQGTPLSDVAAGVCTLFILVFASALLWAYANWWYAALLPLSVASIAVAGQLWRSPHRRRKIGIAMAIIAINLSAVLAFAMASFSGDSGIFWGMVISAVLGLGAGIAAAVIYRAAVDEAVARDMQAESAS